MRFWNESQSDPHGVKEVVLDPNFVGSRQKRPYTLDDDLLTFSDKDTAPGVESYAIRWKKVT